MRILMTLDAVGGVWRYAMDLAAELRAAGVSTVFLGFGPGPSERQRHEAEATGVLDWADAEPGDALWDVAVLTVGHEERLPEVERGYGQSLDVDVIRGWWALRRLGAVRWMSEHGYDATGDLETLRRTAVS